MGRRAHTSRQHPTFGWDRMLSASPSLCSGCCEEIPEADVPLIVWSPDGKTAWQYCAACEAPILTLLAGAAPPAPALQPDIGP